MTLITIMNEFCFKEPRCDDFRLDIIKEHFSTNDT